MQLYSQKFYAATKTYNQSSAQTIVPLIVEMLHPESVVDVGCAAGTWLSEFRRLGTADIFGLDTSYVKEDLLELPKDSFRAVDLEEQFRMERTFDLVTSLEVAEHLPESSAKGFVESLTRLGPVVVFSAAIPFQGGTHHLNEQWPAYWANLFAAHEYIAIDCFRRVLWDNPSVAWWYAQNLILYVRRDYLESHPQLKSDSAAGTPIPLIHPLRYMATADITAVPFRRLLRALPAAFMNGARRSHRIFLKSRLNQLAGGTHR